MSDVAWANLWSPAAAVAPAAPPALTDLWDARGRLEADYLTDLPPAARCYLEHAIGQGTVLAGCVKLQMHGEIKLKRWHKFTANEIIHRNRDFSWRARSRMFGVPIQGFDAMIAGKSSRRWNALGLLPLSRHSGPEFARSAAGRAMAESVWLPSALCSANVRWTALTERNPHAYIVMDDRWAALELAIDATGRLQTFSLMRWGRVSEQSFHYHPFGAVVEDEGTFHGYTIPTRLRMGYFVGSSRFDRDGEFLRVIVDNATFV